jgi:hypothetical protein
VRDLVRKSNRHLLSAKRLGRRVGVGFHRLVREGVGGRSLSPGGHYRSWLALVEGSAFSIQHCSLDRSGGTWCAN